jgi:hypothetical protein
MVKQARPWDFALFSGNNVALFLSNWLLAKSRKGIQTCCCKKRTALVGEASSAG